MRVLTLACEAMQRIAWATDLHLNFASLARCEEFIESVREVDADMLLIGGDISESEDVVWHLQRLSEQTGLPIQFVLGNHDFYHGSFVGVRQKVRAACDANPSLNYLSGNKPIGVGHGWALIGDDCPADTRCGDALGSPVQMQDFRLIEDFHGLAADRRLRVLRREGAAAAARLGVQLTAAAALAQKIMVLTHVPPFREACWYEGRLTDDAWAPFFVCHTAGWQLKRFCKTHPNHQVLVLCGHTHAPGKSRILSNLMCWTGAAEYGQPEITAILELEQLDSSRLESWDVDLDLAIP